MARVKQDITHYLPTALAREELTINTSRWPELSALPLGSTRHSLGHPTGSAACTPLCIPAPTGNGTRGTWGAAPSSRAGLGARDTAGGWQGTGQGTALQEESPGAARWASTRHRRRQTHKQNKKGARQALPKEGHTSMISR